MKIMFNDLIPKKQKELLDYLGLESPNEGNYNEVPLFVLFDVNRNCRKKGERNRLVVSFLTTR